MKKYWIAKEYTETPGVRTGEFSGEDFRKNVLKKLICELKDEEILEINLDGGYGYASSFLEEAFGGLVRSDNFDKEYLINHINFISHDEKELPKKIISYIEDAIPEIKGDE